MKISDPMDNLKKAAHEAGLDWSIIQERSTVLGKPTKFSARRLREPKKMTTRQLITVSARMQCQIAADEWAKRNIEGFDEAIQKARTLKWHWIPDEHHELTRVNKAMHIVNAFREAALSRCEVEQT